MPRRVQPPPLLRAGQHHAALARDCTCQPPWLRRNHRPLPVLRSRGCVVKGTVTRPITTITNIKGLKRPPPSPGTPSCRAVIQGYVLPRLPAISHRVQLPWPLEVTRRNAEEPRPPLPLSERGLYSSVFVSAVACDSLWLHNVRERARQQRGADLAARDAASRSRRLAATTATATTTARRGRPTATAGSCRPAAAATTAGATSLSTAGEPEPVAAALAAAASHESRPISAVDQGNQEGESPLTLLLKRPPLRLASVADSL